MRSISDVRWILQSAADAGRMKQSVADNRLFSTLFRVSLPTEPTLNFVYTVADNATQTMCVDRRSSQLMISWSGAGDSPTRALAATDSGSVSMIRPSEPTPETVFYVFVNRTKRRRQRSWFNAGRLMMLLLPISSVSATGNRISPAPMQRWWPIASSWTIELRFSSRFNRFTLMTCDSIR